MKAFLFVGLLSCCAQLGAVAGDVSPPCPRLVTEPGVQFSSAARKWQGIPSIERTVGGRLWATWYAGPTSEGDPGNFQLLVTSDDDGRTWSEPVAVFYPQPVESSRTGDGHVWIDPRGRMWFFVNRYFASDNPPHPRTVWAFCAENPEVAHPRWSEPVFVGYGLVLNKPTVLKNGEWLNPVDYFWGDPNATDPRGGKGARVYSSTNQGATWNFKAELQIPEVTYAEHMFVERRDQSLWLLARTKYGMAQSESGDGGKTWTVAEPFTKAMNINTRFHVRRLNSGRILLVLNDHPTQRSHLSALLSDDDGRTWPHRLVLDERSTSYPDATPETKDGFVYVIYDQDRYKRGAQQILFAKFTEQDVVAGKIVTPGTRLREKINRLADYGGGIDDSWTMQHDARAKAREAKRKSDAEAGPRKSGETVETAPVSVTPKMTEPARAGTKTP